MPNEYLKDGDVAFIGLNSRDNASALPQGYVSQSANFRLDRGVATVRKGLKRKTIGELVGKTVYGSDAYLNSAGQEVIIVVVTDGLYTYNPQTEALSSKIAFPAGETITTPDGCEIVTAIDKAFITRGHSKRPLMWDLANTITALSTVQSVQGHEFPSCNGLMYYNNRFIATGQYWSNGNYTQTLRSRDTVCVSNYLDANNWNILDSFTFNYGSNDEVTAISSWTLNEFLVFMRNSIFYVNIGLGRYATGQALSTDTFSKSLVTDLGCLAKKSVVQAGGGIFFLSDNGVYFLQPQPNGSDAMRLLTVADPLSSPIDDVIQRINKTYGYRSVATYWNNRYYLAVPLDDSQVNNTVLVYNFILKAWESVDTYPSGFDVQNFVIAKKDNQRRMFAVDSDQGIFLMEEGNSDEYGTSTGTPILPFYLPATLSEVEFQQVPITATLKTRAFNFGGVGEKRFSSCDVDLTCAAGSQVVTTSEVINPDDISVIDTFGSEFTEDSTRRNPIRKTGSACQLRFDTSNLRPSIKSVYVYASVKQKNNKNTI